MLSFKDFITVDYTQSGDEYLAYRAQKRHRGVLGEACWQGYTQKGMKPKNGKMVPNCVPEEDQQNEVLSFQGRRALARAMKKNKAKLKLSRRRAAQKTVGHDKLIQRAERQARNQLFKKFSKDISRTDMSPARRGEIEKKVVKAKSKVAALARKILPQIRQAAKDRKR